jgi:hypothetical protein
MASPYYQEGRYRGEIVAQALGQAGTGTPQLVIRFKVIEFEDGTPIDHQYERTIFRAITAKTMPYLLEDLKTLGYNRDSFRYLDPNENEHHSFIGQDFIAFCQHKRDLQDNLREQWGVATAGIGKLEVAPLESKKLRELDNLFGKQLRSELLNSVKPEAHHRATVAAAESEHITEDDVPF